MGGQHAAHLILFCTSLHCPVMRSQSAARLWFSSLNCFSCLSSFVLRLFSELCSLKRDSKAGDSQRGTFGQIQRG